MPATYEVLEGVVQQQSSNDNGFKLLERWLSYDKRYDGRHPKPGERVKVRVQNERFIVALVAEDQELPPEPPQRRMGGSYRSPEEERRIVRQAALKSAVAWLTTFSAAEQKPTSADVLKLAEKFETWVYR